MKSKLNRVPKLVDPGWLSSAFLILLVGGAAGGVLAGYSPAVMIAGAALALFFWEIIQQFFYRGNDRFTFRDGLRWEQSKPLVVSVGIGLLIAETGLQVHFSLPFGIVVLAVLLILFGFFRFCRLTSR